ncbi:MAG TPA: hypothetical protein VFA18_16725 [Gemmataceae bacterium]|nr:hypothetical protein [Gemmataceae bacterium]
MSIAAPPLMTAEEMLALPLDGMERWLIRGQLREKPMTHRRTVKIIRPTAEPELVNVQQELSAEPHLPGFRVAVARLFPEKSSQDECRPSVL